MCIADICNSIRPGQNEDFRYVQWQLYCCAIMYKHIMITDHRHGESKEAESLLLLSVMENGQIWWLNHSCLTLIFKKQKRKTVNMIFSHKNRTSRRGREEGCDSPYWSIKALLTNQCTNYFISITKMKIKWYAMKMQNTMHILTVKWHLFLEKFKIIIILWQFHYTVLLIYDKAIRK